MRLTRRILHHRANPVKFDYPTKNQQLEQQLFDFMQKQNGLGLAAPQVGIKSRVFVMKINDRTWACFNPEIEQAGQKLVGFAEGCLSFPGDECTITRPQTVTVRYQDYKGQWYHETLSGLESRCFQHELDHLDGITMWDRLKEQHAE